MIKTVLAVGAVFLTTLGSVACADTKAEARQAVASMPADMRDKLAVQLYSFRNELKADMTKAMKDVRALGFRHVELYQGMGEPSEVRKALKAAKLKAMGSHIGLDTLKDPAGAVAFAKAMGIKRLAVPWIKSSPEDQLFSEQEVRDAAALINGACPTLREAGVNLSYHIHGYEFVSHQDATLFALMLDLVPPECLDIQADVFWVAHGGQNAAEFVADPANRVTSLHVKDMSQSEATPQTDGHAADDASVTLGTGKVGIAEVMAAAKKRGVAWYIIEDESPHVWEQVPGSLAYLAGLPK